MSSPMSIALAIVKRNFLANRTVDLPCDGCRECCRGDAIYLHPECGDDPGQYRTVPYNGRLILDHAENGDCTYLGPEGCTIHDSAPVVCRELDCREIVALPQFRSAVPDKRRRKALLLAARGLDRRIQTMEEGLRWTPGTRSLSS